MRGSKVVVFVTGVCGVNCFYCPISVERRKMRALYADEESIQRIEDVLDEISFVQAEGLSITGGEPFQRYDLVIKIIEMVKSAIGSRFHIHLYTSGLGATRSAIEYLDKIGLDEIRFHIVSESVWRLVKYTVNNTSMDVGIEVPALPGSREMLWKIITTASSIGAKFVNINELEVSETNIDNILLRGFKLSSNGRTVHGSMETAMEAVERASAAKLNIAVHYCPALYKDSIQHRERLRRKSNTCKNYYDGISEEGLLIRHGEEVVPLIALCSKKYELGYGAATANSRS
ncbi:MAG: radical SAM protein [Ignisphaera sp.]|nr:radical SAM protein [Ignisphaera sp.]MCX8168414.1 radical SAM protein [Ignisphaera sp.]MDW8086093.1 radical SAM protein [Ignisphaera sp.]